MNEIVDLFFKIALSKWWYFLTMVVFVLFLRFLFTDSPEYVLKQKNIRRTAQLTILFVLCGFILVFVGFLVFFGFIGDLANDLNMVMVTATGFVLLAIFLGSRLTQKQWKPGMEEGWACVYTTNNEHEAQIVRIGLEGGALKLSCRERVMQKLQTLLSIS